MNKDATAVVQDSMSVAPSNAVLLVVDMQRDFLPGGALAVADSDTILKPIAALMESAKFPNIVATQDWHPQGHISFASSHAGHEPFETITLYGHKQVLWPDHCVAGSPGAALCSCLPWDRVRAVVRKGADLDVDSYSGFRNNWNQQGERPPTGLGGYLKECGFTDAFVCGLARDYCVRWTAEDAVELGFRTVVLWDLTRPVDASSDRAVKEALLTRGVEIAESSSY